jgi:membrane-anchored protein YejM (alkaline phosphatase superfamily)
VVPTLLDEFLGCRNAIKDYSNGRNLFKNFEDVRPFVVGSYVNHAFIIGDDVYEINPYHVKEYKQKNIRAKASVPSRDMLKKIADEMGRFLEQN